MSGAGAAGNRYRFSSKEVHPQTGMYYYGFRFYEPNLQRWTSRDPIEEMGGLNLYGFVGNDPVDGVDPFGWSDFNRPVVIPPLTLVPAPLPVLPPTRPVIPSVSAPGRDPNTYNALVPPQWVGTKVGEQMADFNGAAIGMFLPLPIKCPTASKIGPTAWNPLNGPGPLGEKVASTFRGASYTESVTSEATTLYRAYGGKAGELGPYWTRTPPAGPLQSKIDSALLPQWGNTAQNVTRIQVPPGTKIFEGFAAPQGGLVGGGNQVFIPRVDPSWIVK